MSLRTRLLIVLVSTVLFFTALPRVSQAVNLIFSNVTETGGVELKKPAASSLYSPNVFTPFTTYPSARWYNGDAALTNALPNGIGFSGADGRIFSDFIVPVADASGWEVSALLSNNLMSVPVTTASYEIRTGVSNGNGGTLIFFGTVAATQVATGRSLGGFTEYTVMVSGLNIHLAPGTYFLNVAPVNSAAAGTGVSYNTATTGTNAVGAPPGNNGNEFWKTPTSNYAPTTGQGNDFSNGVIGNVTIPCTPPAIVYVNASWAGTPTGNDPDGAGPATYFGCDSFAKIQNGVTGVATGGQVMVAAGTYNEAQILVVRSMTITGAGAATTIINGGNTPISTAGLVRIVTPLSDAGNVTFSGFTVTNPGLSPETGGTHVGVYARPLNAASTTTVSNNNILGVNASDNGVYTIRNVGTVVYDHNVFTNQAFNPIVIERSEGPTDVHHNNISSNGSLAYFNFTYFGTNVTALQRVANNTINGSTAGGIAFYSAYPAAPPRTGTFTNVLIVNNIITNLATGFVGITLFNDALAGNGALGNIQNAVISENIITGTDAAGSRGVSLHGLVTNASITGNDIRHVDRSFSGQTFADHSPVGTQAYLNNFVNNAGGFVNNGTETLNAENNWWGCNAGPGNTGCNSVTGLVDFDPWLVLGVNATPNPIAPGATSDITADMTHNSAAEDISVLGTVPPIPVAFSATEGTISPTNSTITGGQSFATFTSTSNSNGTACATVDNQLTCRNILLTTTTLVPATTPTATDNDYTRLNHAIQIAGSGQIIKLIGIFDWTEPFAAASWAAGSNGILGDADDYRITVPPGVNNVTFTTDNLGDATIQGPGDLPNRDLEGVLVFNGGVNTDWTISNLRFLDFDLSIGMFGGVSPTAFSNTHITNNYIRMARDLASAQDPSENFGIHYSFGANQVISNNVIEIQGDGVSADPIFASDVGIQSDAGTGVDYNGLAIIDNIIRVLNAQSANPQRIIGFFENGQSHQSNINISGNSFINLAVGNDPATNLQTGFRVTSHASNTTTVLYQNNTVSGANLGFEWAAGHDFSGNQAIVLRSNTITGNGTGVLVQSKGVAVLLFNRLVGNTVGVNNVDGTVTAENNWWGCNGGPGATQCNSFSGLVDYDPWIVLGVTATPSTIFPGGTSNVLADMKHNSAGTDISASGAVPPTPVAFSATEGTMNPTTGTITNGEASSTFTSSSTNSGTACATVDNQATCANITVISPGDVSGTKTKGGGNTPGSTVTYTVVLSNASTQAQLDNPGNEFTDTLPSTLTLVSASATSGTATATVGTNTVGWNGSIAAGSSVTITITATINNNVPGGTVVSNQGTINSDADGNGTNEASRPTDDPSTGVANDPTSFTVVSSSNVSGTKTKSGGSTPGSTVTYTVVLSNGSSSAQFDNPGNEFTDVLPSELVLVSATATSGIATANTGTNTVSWNGGLAGNGGSVTITINSTLNNVPEGTIVSNQGTINSDDDGNGTNEASRQTDDPSVGGASDPTTFVVDSKADLTISKSHSGNFNPGQVGATYTITVTNIGTGVTNGVVTVTDEVPVGLTPTGPNGTVGGWTCSIVEQTVTCTRSDALTGGGATYAAINLTVTVANPAPLTVTNTATVSGGGEVNTTNNTASDPTTINCSPDVALNNGSTLMISRFRENGPAGPQDEFVEIHNPSQVPHKVASGTCDGGGYGVYASAGNGTTSNTSTLVCYIPNGTVIPGGSYYLCTGVTYSLGNLGRNGGPGGAKATSDAPIGCGGTCGSNIPDDAGLALLNRAEPTFSGNLAILEFGEVVYDKVGFGPYGSTAPAPGYPSLATAYCEGGVAGCLKPVGDASTGAACANPSGLFPVFPAPPACYGLAGQYALLRRQTLFNANEGIEHQDTNNNGNDFILVSPNPASNMGMAVTGVSGVSAVLGAAAPFNRSASPDTPAAKLTRSPFDGTNQFGPRNLERRFTPDPTVANPANNPLGTLILRVKFTNNTGIPMIGIRVGVNNLSTLCGPPSASSMVGTGEARNMASSPDCGTGGFTAIMKALNSTSQVIVDGGGTAWLVNGTVLDDLSVGATPGSGPLSPNGGGIDSTFLINPSSDNTSVGDGVTGGVGIFATTIGTSGPTQELRLQVKLGVVRNGRFILLVVPIAKPAPTPTP